MQHGQSKRCGQYDQEAQKAWVRGLGKGRRPTTQKTKCQMTRKSLLPVLALDEKLPTGNAASDKQDVTRAGAEESLVG